MAAHYYMDKVICPHCDHEYNADEMTQSDIDLYALAPNEECETVECPVCDKEFWVQGGYSPQYTTAFAEEDL